MKENGGVSLTPYAGIKDEKAIVDLEEYARTTKACHVKLQSIWLDLELSPISQTQQLDEITQRALGVWTAAVEHAEAHRQSVRSRIDEASSEIRKISEQLGERTALEESQTSGGSLIATGKSVKRQYDEIFGELEAWKRKRTERVDEHDALVSQVSAIKERLGLPFGSARKAAKSSTISRANMEYLRLDLERMRGEKVRRERKMEATLGKLRKLCIEVGADDTEVAATVHPSLRAYHTSMPGHFYSYSSYKPDQEPTGTLPQVDLGDATFTGLEAKVDEMQQLKEARESRAAEMQEVLRNMWTMLEVPLDDENRVVFEKLLDAPARLHAHTLDKCGDEIGRLEACQASVMRTMMAAKEKELTALCASTCLPTPDLTLLLSDIDTGSPGHVADALSKLMKMIGEVTAICARREPIIKTITEVEDAFKEIRWHYQHQQEVVYNSRGRDANRLLQRAIKAEDKRKKLPKLMTRLVESLSMWDDVEGRPFTLGSFRYQEDVLSVIQEELTLMDRIKPKKPEEREKAVKKGGLGAPRKGAHSAPLPPTEPQEPVLTVSEALKLIAAVHAADAHAHAGHHHRPPTSSKASAFGDAMSVADMAMLTPMPQNTQNMNPLQDLVNNLANASVASKRAQNSANRYAQMEALPHLALDDQPNIGSAVVSPAPMMQLLSQSLSVLRSSGTHAPNTLASALTLPGMASRGGPHSPAESDAVSRRSVRSEALTHLSSNIMGGGGGASGVTVRAKGKDRPKTPGSAGSGRARQNNFPEHSVMFPGITQD